VYSSAWKRLYPPYIKELYIVSREVLSGRPLYRFLHIIPIRAPHRRRIWRGLPVKWAKTGTTTQKKDRLSGFSPPPSKPTLNRTIHTLLQKTTKQNTPIKTQTKLTNSPRNLQIYGKRVFSFSEKYCCRNCAFCFIQI